METTIGRQLSERSANTVMPPPSSTDEALLAAIAQGEAAALEVLYGRYSRAVYTVALTVVRDHAEAEELTQEAFLRVWLRAGSYDPVRGRAGTWLLRLTRHLAIDQVRRRRLVVVAGEPANSAARAVDCAEASDLDIEQEVWLDERRHLILTALSALPAKQREVLTHAYYGEMSHAEIAARLGVPLGTVKSRTSLGLRRLRALVGRHDEELNQRAPGVPNRWGKADASLLTAS
jgi:RNA polymerase sigma-70 factor (ECF subfamily)